ncbi:hypothetical protein MPH_05758 [Macrophomina phaseolina MS6]|uniref:Uncharacterized protein n=1 Tax=Macrophomina phaseolina (strain MS6) TaxID=1126212 RepID=K2RQU1_MACPH|nr:hypothetical protein MPH_05758 [Macrophomina phaseolina MS6]
MILRSLAAGLLVPFAAGGVLHPRQDDRPYRVLEVHVNVEVLVQPVAIATFCAQNTVFAYAPSNFFTVTNAPTFISTVLTATRTTSVSSYRTYATERPSGYGYTSAQPSSRAPSTVSSRTIVLPTTSFPFLPTYSPGSSASSVYASRSSALPGPEPSPSAISIFPSSELLEHIRTVVFELAIWYSVVLTEL